MVSQRCNREFFAKPSISGVSKAETELGETERVDDSDTVSSISVIPLLSVNTLQVTYLSDFGAGYSNLES